MISACAASRLGKTVVIIEPGKRIGGLSSGGLGQTDIGNKHAVTGMARDFYRQIGKQYNVLEAWKFEPKVALGVFQKYIDEQGIHVIYGHCISDLSIKKGRIQTIEIKGTYPSKIKDKITIQGKMFIDCSYEGDLLAVAGVSYTVGRENNTVYNETINGVQLMDGHQFPDGVDPYIKEGDPESGLLWGISPGELASNGTGDKKVQAYNFRICLTDDPDNSKPIERPENYDSSKYELLVRLMNKQQDNRNLSDYFIWSIMPNSSMFLPATRWSLFA